MQPDLFNLSNNELKQFWRQQEVQPDTNMEHMDNL